MTSPAILTVIFMGHLPGGPNTKLLKQLSNKGRRGEKSQHLTHLPITVLVPFLTGKEDTRAHVQPASTALCTPQWQAAASGSSMPGTIQTL